LRTGKTGGKSANNNDAGMVVMNNGTLHCASEYDRGAGCGKTARPDLYGGLCGNKVPTMTTKRGIEH